MLNYEITLYNPGDNKKKSKNLILALFFCFSLQLHYNLYER